MSKLLRIRSVLSVSEAARYLQGLVDEEVTPADIFYLGMQGDLQMSVVIRAAYAKSGAIDDNGVFEGDDKPVRHIYGLFDLHYDYGAADLLERRWRPLAGESEQPTDSLDQRIIVRDEATAYLLLERDRGILQEQMTRKYPDSYDEIPEDVDWIVSPIDLPEGSLIVVQTRALLELSNRVLKEQEHTSAFGDDAVSKGEQDADEILAALFDPVNTRQLQTMFPTSDPERWRKWVDKAPRNGLIKARISRGRWNPYLAAEFYIRHGHDRPKTMRILSRHLPLRSVDEAFRFRAMAGDDDLD